MTHNGRRAPHQLTCGLRQNTHVNAMWPSAPDTFRERLALADSRLRRVDEGSVDTPLRPGGWTRKEIVGHLIDSAANNRQRFVRAAIQGNYVGPGYRQQEWVTLMAYRELGWQTLLRWWRGENEILAQVVARIPPSRLETPCVVGDDAPIPLRQLITDYMDHLDHHVAQISGTPEGVSE